MKNLRIKIAILLSLVFFFAGIFTLTSYGTNWDTINHLPRGQAYLQFFLTGLKDYSNLPSYPKKGYQDPSVLYPQIFGRSFYENSETTFAYFLQYGGDGHPPLSDILSSVFNRILYGKLRIFDDIDSYHVYGVLLAATLVGLVFYWVSGKYGILSGVIASASLSMYPLFWAESHFNTEKDVPETVFWSFFLFCIWKGVVKKSPKWILLSGIFFGLALGTKFNIWFSIFVIAPSIAFYFLNKKIKLFSKVNLKLLIVGLIAFVIGFLIFYASWPNLWADPVVGMGNVINFYKRLGIAGASFDPRFMGPFGSNLYPFFWVIITTPPIILFFGAIGTIFSLRNFRKDPLLLLFLLWFLIPILRVTWHGANIYGGIRQIMEYVPALAILAGIGSSFLVSKFKSNFLKFLFVFLTIIILVIPIIKTHPNENAYFNSLIGGLAGAKSKNIPAWGNTFGNPYRTTIAWIDKNLPQNATLALANELQPNVPVIWVRPDISFTALNRSGYLRKGEYALTLTYQGTDTRSYYDMYLSKFLKPVYQEKVDGVSVITVWKNDEEHLKEPWIEKKVPKINIISDKTGFKFDLNNLYKVSRLEIDYKDKNCSKLIGGVFEISNDGSAWTILPDKLPDDWTIAVLGEQPKNGHFIEPFVGQNIRYIKLELNPSDTCLLKNFTNVNFFYLE